MSPNTRVMCLETFFVLLFFLDASYRLHASTLITGKSNVCDSCGMASIFITKQRSLSAYAPPAAMGCAGCHHMFSAIQI